MEININAVKKSLRLLGIDLNQYATMAAPLVTEQINAMLKDIEDKPGHSKGLIITKNGNGEYIIVRSDFDPEAGAHITNKGAIKLETLVNEIFKKII